MFCSTREEASWTRSVSSAGPNSKQRFLEYFANARVRIMGSLECQVMYCCIACVNLYGFVGGGTMQPQGHAGGLISRCTRIYTVAFRTLEGGHKNDSMDTWRTQTYAGESASIKKVSHRFDAREDSREVGPWSDV
jgi:hypothetical protein